MSVKNAPSRSLKSCYKPLDDSDSDDDEDLTALLAQPVFGHKKSIAPSSDAATAVTPPSPPSLDAKELEKQARQRVSDLSLNLVDNVSSVDQLAWYQPKGKSPIPCRRGCHPDEAIGLEGLDKRKSNSPHYELIQFLGHRSKYCSKYDLSHQTHLKAFIVTNTVAVAVAEQENTFEENLRKFIKDIKKNDTHFQEHQGNSNKRRLLLLEEEYVIRAMLEKVQAKQQQKQQEEQHSETNNNANAAETTEEEDQLKPAAVDTVVGDVSLVVDEDKSDDDDDDDDDMDLLSPGKGKKETLRDGDIIEYYEQNKVAGNPEDLKRTRVLGVNRKNTFPLVLENGDALARDHPVKLLQRRLRGHMEDNQGGVYKRMDAYVLVTCGTQNMRAGIQLRAKNIATLLNQAKDDMNDSLEKDFFREFKVPAAAAGAGDNDVLSCTPDLGEDNDDDDSVGDGNGTAKGNTPGVAKQARDSNSKRRGRQSTGTILKQAPQARAAVSQYRRTSLQPQQSLEPADEQPQQPAWKVHLSGLILAEEAKSDLRRYIPHMTMPQLQLALNVWAHLEQKQQTLNNPPLATTAIRTADSALLLTDLALDLNVSTGRLESFLNGDTRKQIGPRHLKEIDGALTNWLAGQPPCPSLAETNAASDKTDDSNDATAAAAKAAQSESKKRQSANEMKDGTPKKRLKEGGVNEKTPLKGFLVGSAVSTASKRTKRGSVVQSSSTETPARKKRRESQAKERLDLSQPAAAKASNVRRISVAIIQDPKSVRPQKRRSSMPNELMNDTATPQKKRRRSEWATEPVVETTTTKGEPAWKIDLSELMEIEKEAIKKKSGRYKPHMAVEQLEFAMNQVWPELERLRLGQSKKQKMEQVLATLSIDLGISHIGLTVFLQGDKGHTLSSTKIARIQAALTEWLAGRTL
jgi:hypothetical protein